MRLVSDCVLKRCREQPVWSPGEDFKKYETRAAALKLATTKSCLRCRARSESTEQWHDNVDNKAYDAAWSERNDRLFELGRQRSVPPKRGWFEDDYGRDDADYKALYD